MMPDSAQHIALWKAAVGRLASERNELGIEPMLKTALLTLAATCADRDGRLANWLKMTATIASGVDTKTAAAYLISIFVWRFDEILATLYLSGVPVPQLTADDIGVQMLVGSHGSSKDIQFRFQFREAGAPALSSDRAAFRRALIDIHRPLVEALHGATSLSHSALWRLVGDGISGGFLSYGKQHGCPKRSADEAGAILATAPLHNPQWAFVQVGGPGMVPEWFRLRGGCCRLYLTDGGDYCTTCVLRKRSDQLERLSAFMAGRI